MHRIDHDASHHVGPRDVMPQDRLMAGVMPGAEAERLTPRFLLAILKDPE